MKNWAFDPSELCVVQAAVKRYKRHLHTQKKQTQPPTPN